MVLVRVFPSIRNDDGSARQQESVISADVTCRCTQRQLHWQLLRYEHKGAAAAKLFLFLPSVVSAPREEGARCRAKYVRPPTFVYDFSSATLRYCYFC